VEAGRLSEDSYPRLIQAMEIDERAALKACSWGLGQVLGENHKAVGYDTVEEMVRAFMDDEERHLEATVQFLVANGLDDDLREHRWEALARGYNGPGYAKNGYHLKLPAAFKKWAKRPDTPFDPSQQLEQAVEQAVKPEPKRQWAEEALAPFEVEAIQKRLRELGYFIVGKVDGRWGPATVAAITALQAQARARHPELAVDGHWGPATKAALADDANRRVVPEARANTTLRDLREQGSSTIRAADGVSWIATMQGAVFFVITFLPLVAENFAAVASWWPNSGRFSRSCRPGPSGRSVLPARAISPGRPSA
jgi:N-acetylmuramidase/Putative peptidoglycan binding domain